MYACLAPHICVYDCVFVCFLCACVYTFASMGVCVRLRVYAFVCSCMFANACVLLCLVVYV